MEALGRDGLKLLHPAKFKKLLEEARAQRNENGDGLRCSSCGGVQMTPSATEAHLEKGAKSDPAHPHPPYPVDALPPELARLVR